MNCMSHAFNQYLSHSSQCQKFHKISMYFCVHCEHHCGTSLQKWHILINSMITINGPLIPMAVPSILKLHSSFLKTTLLSCSATSCALYNRTKHSRGYSRIFRLFEYPTIVVACSRLQPTTVPNYQEPGTGYNRRQIPKKYFWKSEKRSFFTQNLRQQSASYCYSWTFRDPYFYLKQTQWSTFFLFWQK